MTDSKLNEATFEQVYNLATPEEIIDDARNGRMYILVDAEDRENEGDLIIPAQFATPDAINFMAKFGRGLICLAIEQAKAETLGLSNMSADNRSRFETAFTQSIEAREGVTTGISAGDRSHTIQTAIDPESRADDIGLKIGTIEDLVAYRMKKDHFVKHVATSDFTSQNGDEFKIHVYRNFLDGKEHVALSKGEPSEDTETLVRVQHNA